MDLGIQGRQALVFGGSRGMGRACALRFAQEGVGVTIAARTRETLQRAAEEMSAQTGNPVRFVVADITTAAGRDAALAACPAPDILVNNAGVIPSGSLFDINEDAWRSGWELKIYGYINLCRFYYPRMKAQGGGIIINNIGNGGEITDPLYIAGATGNASLMALAER